MKMGPVVNDIITRTLSFASRLGQLVSLSVLEVFGSRVMFPYLVG